MLSLRRFARRDIAHRLRARVAASDASRGRCFLLRAARRESRAARPLRSVHADGRAGSAAGASGWIYRAFRPRRARRGGLARARGGRAHARRHRPHAVDRRTPRRRARRQSSPTAWMRPSRATEVSARDSGWSWVGSSPDWRTTSQRAVAGPAPACSRTRSISSSSTIAHRAALFRHFGDAGWRRRFPNFATQIYSVLALAVVARHGLDDRALPAAIATADRLLEMQLPDGGWPWLFDAERGTVVERYEIYSVHQDAMAPMALLELWEVCRDPRFTDAVARGLAWIHGGNELGMNMVDRANGLVLRSIRRKPRPRPALGWSEDGRIARRHVDARSDRAPDRDQPNRPPVSLRLGARGLVRTRGRSQPRTASTEASARACSRHERRHESLTYAIVTPARNERDNLQRLAESVLAQDHAPLSWVIVDDGSDDGMRRGCRRSRTTLRLDPGRGNRRGRSQPRDGTAAGPRSLGVPTWSQQPACPRRRVRQGGC